MFVLCLNVCFYVSKYDLVFLGYSICSLKSKNMNVYVTWKLNCLVFALCVLDTDSVRPQTPKRVRHWMDDCINAVGC